MYVYIDQTLRTREVLNHPLIIQDACNVSCLFERINSVYTVKLKKYSKKIPNNFYRFSTWNRNLNPLFRLLLNRLLHAVLLLHDKTCVQFRKSFNILPVM